jgi:hypothetical protein
MSKKIGAIVAGASLLTLVGAFVVYYLNRENKIYVEYFVDEKLIHGSSKSLFEDINDEICIKTQGYNPVFYHKNEILCFFKSCRNQKRMVIVLSTHIFKTEIGFDDQTTRDKICDDLKIKYKKTWNSRIFDIGEKCTPKGDIKFENGKLVIYNIEGVNHKIDFKNILIIDIFYVKISIVTINTTHHLQLLHKARVFNIYESL